MFNISIMDMSLRLINFLLRNHHTYQVLDAQTLVFGINHQIIIIK